MSVTALFLLSSLGIGITVQAQDCSKPVGGPHMSLRDDSASLTTFPDGSRVSFVCDVGYTSAGGSASITCTGGVWSALRLVCERKNCGSAGEIDNGQIDYPEGTEFGDKAVFSCNIGFRLVGKSQSFCGDQGWMERLPVCEVMTCDPPDAVENGLFSPVKDFYEYRDVVTHTCNKDFTLEGSNTITCSEDGTFTPDSPRCITVDCPDPVGPKAEWAAGSRPPYKYLSTVRLRCQPQHTMTGSDTVTCQINSKWSPPPPQCEQIITPTKRTTTSTTTTPPSPPATKDPKDSGSDHSLPLGVAFGVLITAAVLTVCGCYCFGVPACIKRNRGAWRGNTDKEATKDGEDVALS